MDLSDVEMENSSDYDDESECSDSDTQFNEDEYDEFMEKVNDLASTIEEFWQEIEEDTELEYIYEDEIVTFDFIHTKFLQTLSENIQNIFSLYSEMTNITDHGFDIKINKEETRFHLHISYIYENVNTVFRIALVEH